MTENELLGHITAACRDLRLLCFHDHDARRNIRGFPDLVIAGPGGVIWAELKTPAGELSSDQAQWKWTLIGAGQNYKIWRPADWTTGRIMQELATLRSTTCASK